MSVGDSLKSYSIVCPRRRSHRRGDWRSMGTNGNEYPVAL